ncbi:putative mitotic check point protein [Eutypa lata UCREL1]|uniref:Putative mitotic check point protein n=1 Tax=Eutypa lata (strain UCR-EL1) TaxID=1287681 RepID=M7SAH3_EUTLA|nr:putative mitotic check point protein [Eutypa lata UCREL1]
MMPMPMPDPTKEPNPIAGLAPAITAAELYVPPSPRTNRLRKLQSAHNLGAAARNAAANGINNGGGGGVAQQPSLITQQRLKDLQERTTSPTRRHPLSSNRSPQRHRSNSDAPTPPPNLIPSSTFNPAIPLRTKRSALSRSSPAADTMSLERLIRDGPPNGDVRGALESARLKVLDQGIKADSDGMSSSRIYVWLILLDAPFLETDAYLKLIHRGASPAYAKIRNDTFRTLTTDPLFRRRVSEASLIRLLNAVAWKLHDAKEEARSPSRPPTSSSRQSLPCSSGGGYGSRPSSSRSDVSMMQSSPAAKNRARALTLTMEGSDAGGGGANASSSEPGTYVQGMNVLAAPFLYAARSEAEAFVAFHRLLTKECPGYIRGAMDGVHRGLALVDKVLAIVDVKLSLYLTTKGLSAEIYAFPSVLTLCACTPPLPEVLRLWDFLFAYGPHLNIPCIVAQLIMMRNELLGSSSPNKLLRSFPALQADQIKRTALAIVKMLPDDVYAEIIAHAL